MVERGTVGHEQHGRPIWLERMEFELLGFIAFSPIYAGSLSKLSGDIKGLKAKNNLAMASKSYFREL